MGKGGQDYGKRDANVSPVAQDVFPAWAKDVHECEKHFGVDRKVGLRSDEVESRRKIHGYNELEKHDGVSVWRLILDQFNDTLVRILLAAAVISFVLAWYDGDEGGEMEITAFVEPLVIFLILIVNAIVGVWQESNAEKALEALKEIQSESATVIRDGIRIPNLPAKELVPGDIVELKVGDKVPADMRVLELISSTLRLEQGSLTGESEAVNKTNKPVSADTDIQGKRSMVFAGTTVVNGNCICMVTQIGMGTEIGKVHEQIHVASQSEEDTPLKKKLNEFGEALTAIIGVICLLVWLINVKYFLTWEYVDGWPSNFKFSFEKCTYYFEIAVALAVAAIPEGLPAVITTCLALGTRKMAQKNALVRKLPSVETLGCTTVICSDKTGTLTTNQMAVSKLVATGSRADSLRTFKVDGTTYNPLDGKIQDWPTGSVDVNLQTIAKIAAVCNDAGVSQSDHKFLSNGMPTEAALKVLVEKTGPLSQTHLEFSSLRFEAGVQIQLRNMGKKKMTLLVRQLDKLSDLPDNVIDNILRFLPLHCAIKTSVLSTNWRFNWTRKENLVLDKDFSLNANYVEWYEQLNYMNIVSSVLLSHSGRIRVFHLYVPGIFQSTEFVNAINMWLLYVSRNGVEDLRLEYQNSNGNNNHKVPCSLFQHPALKHLSMINVVDPPSHNFKGVSYILSLELYFQDVAKDYLSNLMMKCPLLEKISLTVYCVKDPIVIIFSSKLKMLRIKYHFGFDLILKYIPNLSILSLKGFGRHAVNFPIKCQDITGFFGVVPNIEDMTLTGEILVVWAEQNLPERLPVPLQNLMSLTVCNLNVYSASQIRSLACLLNSSPKLHTLDISISEPNFREQHRPQIMGEVENLNNLKIVKVSNINGFIMYEIVLIEMILSKSPILEKLYLTSDPNVDPKVELNMVTDVMKLRRASTQAEIIYSKSKI